MSRLANREDELTDLNAEYNKVIHQRDIMLEQIKKVELTFSKQVQRQAHEQKKIVALKRANKHRNIAHHLHHHGINLDGHPERFHLLQRHQSSQMCLNLQELSPRMRAKLLHLGREKEFSGVDKKSRVVNATVILGSNGVGKQHSPTPQKQIKRKSPREILTQLLAIQWERRLIDQAFVSTKRETKFTKGDW